MNTSSYILALNATEGFLQLVVGTPLTDGSNKQGSLTPKRSQRGSGGIKCVQEWRLPSQGAEILVPVLRDCLDKLGIGIGEIGKLACVTGPGSFTGIRLATSFASGLSLATGASMAGLPYLPLLADSTAAVLGSLLPAEALLWTVTHARRDLVHAQPFTREGKDADMTAVSDIVVVSLDEFVSLIMETRKQTVLLGSGITRNRPFFEERFAPAGKKLPVMLGKNFDTPLASSLFEAACRAEYGYAELEPYYVRPSDAEESLDQIAPKLGLDVGQVLSAYKTFQQQ